MTRKTYTPGRLALRVEGRMWNAYWAKPDTMQDAVLVGSIAMAAVTDNERRKQAFIDLMSDFVADGIEQAFGQRPVSMETHRAPEGERSGNA
jgi:hypothetical protein